MVFVIVLGRVLQLYVYVPSGLLKDQSIVVRLENACVFPGFRFLKNSQHIRG